MGLQDSSLLCSCCSMLYVFSSRYGWVTIPVWGCPKSIDTFVIYIDMTNLSSAFSSINRFWHGATSLLTSTRSYLRMGKETGNLVPATWPLCRSQSYVADLVPRRRRHLGVTCSVLGMPEDSKAEKILGSSYLLAFFWWAVCLLAGLRSKSWSRRKHTAVTVNSR